MSQMGVLFLNMIKLYFLSILQNAIILVKKNLVLVHCFFFFYLKIVSVENKTEFVKSLNKGRAKHFQCNFEL